MTDGQVGQADGPQGKKERTTVEANHRMEKANDRLEKANGQLAGLVGGRQSMTDREGAQAGERSPALSAIEQWRGGELQVLRREPWLLYLVLTGERNINLERVGSLQDRESKYVLDYVERSLRILHTHPLAAKSLWLAEEALKWAEVAKTGRPHHRKLWRAKGYNLFAHNLGSAQIYRDHAAHIEGGDAGDRAVVETLIATHGLVGQYIRGEVTLHANRPLFELVEKNVMSAAELEPLLLALNHAVIGAVDEGLWEQVKEETAAVIAQIVQGHFTETFNLAERLRRMRRVAAQSGEDFDQEFATFRAEEAAVAKVEALLQDAELWYVEAAWFDFSFTEFMKALVLVASAAQAQSVHRISFQPLMDDLYYQHDGRKRINIYMKRILEHYLAAHSFAELLAGRFQDNPHVTHEVTIHEDLADTVFFRFRFSAAAGKLIEFCVEAEKSDVLYERAIVLLFDLFGLRKDAYDRFYEEESYLATMNQSVDAKAVILDYVVGERVVDIGPGGGALMDLIVERFPAITVLGVDIAQNVLDALTKRQRLENRPWQVQYGDALDLGASFTPGSVDTIIFCSILHELYSYIDYNGRKFNRETLAAALTSAYAVLPVGGRIIIRDGIMTEPTDATRIIRFHSEEGLRFLERYAADFRGRDIRYTSIGRNEVQLTVNDAMEFLYTYTWGEKSYVHEVNEQFGYFTPGEYRQFIHDTLGDTAAVLECQHYLQEGYAIALSQKISLFDEAHQPVRLPDSTCLIVIEKGSSSSS